LLSPIFLVIFKQVHGGGDNFQLADLKKYFEILKESFENLVSEMKDLKDEGIVIEGLEHLEFVFSEQGDLKFLDLLEGKFKNTQNLAKQLLYFMRYWWSKS